MSLREPTPAAEIPLRGRLDQKREIVDLVPDVPDDNLLEHRSEESRFGLPSDEREVEYPPKEVLRPNLTADGVLEPDVISDADESAESTIPTSVGTRELSVSSENNEHTATEQATETAGIESATTESPAAEKATTEDLVPSVTLSEPLDEAVSDRRADERQAADVAESADVAQSQLQTQPAETKRPIETVAAAGSLQSESVVAETAVTSQSSSKKPRMSQSRASQTRASRPRKQPASAKDEGTKSMSRKFRIDTPGGERTEQPASEPKNVAGGKIQSNSKSGRRHRVDSGSSVSETLETGDRRTRTQGRPRRRYIDEPHDSVARGPHFQVTAPRRSNFTSVTGQFLAYVGVLGLTVGTAMVIYGHFGGYSEYTPTGWLVTTVAQMMLFLGVINLVSGGMEQTNSDVSQRMEYLGSQLMRIEQVAEEALRGPKISAQRYADPDAEVAASEREQVVAED